MNRIAKHFVAVITLSCVAAAASAASQALVSPGEPHGVVRVDVERKAEHIYPVKVVEINGDLVSADDKVALWLKPGKHTLTVKGMVNRSNTFGVSRTIGQGNEDNSVEIDVEQGKVYYLGAKVNPREGGRWEPVVWKVESEKAS